MKRVILYTGKGGTGKSVISCATGLKLAELGYNTLVMSVDPAHTLADAFGKRVGNEPENIVDNLFAVQIDPVAEVKKNFYVIQDYLASVLEAKGIDEALAYEIASLPSTTQFFALLRLDDYLQEGIFDTIILDTVPSGETLRYLYFPKLIGNISRKLIKIVSPIAEIGKILEPILHIPAPSKEVISKVSLFEKIERLANVLTNQDECSVRLVANPDSFSIETMKRTLIVSNLYGVNVDLTIINKVLPDEIQDPYFSKWKDTQRKYIEFAKTSFYPVPLKILKLFNSELKGIEMLKICNDELFKDEDPSKVYFKGSPFELRRLSNGILVRFRVPFTGKENFEIERIGEELLIKVKLDTGEVVNVFPLPAIANVMSLRNAKLKDGILEVKFVREV